MIYIRYRSRDFRIVQAYYMLISRGIYYYMSMYNMVRVQLFIFDNYLYCNDTKRRKSFDNIITYNICLLY